MTGPEAGTDPLTTSGSAPGFIYAGRCYQTRTIPVNGVPTSCAVCYDLRTGEQYYAIPTSQGGTTPTSINYIWGGGLGGLTGEVPGGTGEVGTAVELLSIGTTLLKINPLTGAINTNVTGMTGTKIGEFVISMQTNNTAIGNRLINWTTRGTSTNFTSRIVENRSVTFSSIGASIDWDSGYFGSLSTLSYQGAPYGVRIIGYNVYSGKMTCNTTDTLCPYTTSQTIVDHGKIACLMLDGYAAAWDLGTGQRVWKSQQTYTTGGYPWGIWGAYSSASYGGNLILNEYDGVYAFNWDNGKISWIYKDPCPAFETPYTTDNNTINVNPFNTGVSIVDGMVYTYNTEHTPALPVERSWKFHCFNATTGVGIWNITTPMSPGAMADGYTTAGGQDGYMYVFGKGKSDTTVTASPKVVTDGASVLIEGTVTDLSPAQAGTPCVSRGSMTTQMEYLHIQLPVDGIYHNVSMTGVPVTLTAIDPNNNVAEIGTVTTNPYYGTFSIEWKPHVQGTYTIMATFAGDDSYGISAASTAVSVDPAIVTTTPQPAAAIPDYTMTIVAAAFAIIIALVIAIAVAVMLIKRK